MLAAVVSTTVLFALHQLLFGFHWENNDDCHQAMIVSGALLGTAPSEYVLNVHVFLNLLLKALYQLAGSVPWYFLYEVTLQWLSGVVLQYLLIRRFGLRSGILSYCLFFFMVQSYLLVFLQFTSTSIFAGCIAGLLVMHVRLSGSIQSIRQACKSRLLLLTAVLWTGAALLRFPTAIFSLLLTAPVQVLQKTPGESSKRAVIAAYAIALVAMAGLEIINTTYFCASPHWRDAYQARYPFIKLVDFGGIAGNAKADAELMRAARWSVNDAAMLNYFMYFDPELFSIERLNAAASSTPLFLRRDASPQYVALEVRHILKNRGMWSIWILTFLCIPFIGNGFGFDRKRFALAVAIVLGALFYVILALKCPARCYSPCFAYLAALALVNLDMSKVAAYVLFVRDVAFTNKKFAVTKVAAVVASTALLCVSAFAVASSLYWTLLQRTAFHYRQRVHTYKLVDYLKQNQGVFIFFGGAFPFERLPATCNWKDTFEGIHVVPTWTYDPWAEACLARAGLSFASLKDLAHPGLYIIDCDYMPQEKLYRRYIREHCGKNIELVQHGRFEELQVNVLTVRELKDALPELSPDQEVIKVPVDH